MTRTRLAAAALAVAALVLGGGGGTAQASWAKPADPTVTAPDTALICSEPCFDNWYWDNGATNIGVDHRVDGVYAAGPYDGLLAPGQDTKSKWGWDWTEGAYVAPGECLTAAYTPVHQLITWTYYGKFKAGGQSATFAFDRRYNWQLKRYLSGSSVCATP